MHTSVDSEARLYRGWAERLTADGVITDPWLDGRPRFSPRPVLLSPALDARLRAAAEAVTRLHDLGAQLAWRDAAVLRRYFALTPTEERMWRASGAAWHGIARADVFVTDEGVRVCELNSDTPSGEAEAVRLGALAARAAGEDPNVGLEAQLCRLVRAVAPPARRQLTVGIVYPTEMVEDLSMIELYRRSFAARGWHVVLGAPFNLGRDACGGVTLLGRRCDVVVRHYKTDWWAERVPTWRGQPAFADAAPLEGPLDCLLDGVARGVCAVVNPFGAVVTQNKRMLALLWEEEARLPTAARVWLRRYLPYTARLETVPRARLEAERRQWVLKSDYGCEGAEVIVGAEVGDAEWRAALALAVPERFVVQRRFRARRDAEGHEVNFGVYVIGGVASGYFCRVQRGATDERALAAPVCVREGGQEVWR